MSCSDPHVRAVMAVMLIRRCYVYRQLEALDKELQQLSHIKENVDTKVKPNIHYFIALLFKPVMFSFEGKTYFHFFNLPFVPLSWS